MIRQSSVTLRILPQLLLGLILAACWGCYPIGALVYKVAGPLPIDARYVPDPQSPMLVFVERYSPGGAASNIEAAQECELLARAIQDHLMRKNVAPIVDAMSIAALRTADPLKFRAMTVSQIGAQVGARQVLYVNLTHSSLKMTEGSDLIRGQMAGVIKVVDVDSGAVLFPVDAGDGYPVSVQTPITSVREGVSPQAARTNMIRQMGEAVARVFYKHQPEYESPPE